MIHEAPFSTLPEGTRVPVDMVGDGFTWKRELSENPLVSVVVPVYNKRAYLQACLDSLYAQTYPNIEIILIDDMSTDGSREYIASITHPRVVTILNQTNRGAGGASNVGILAAKGELIARQDADDVSFPMRIQSQVRAFQEDTELVLCSGLSIKQDEDGRLLGTIGKPLSAEELPLLLLVANQLIHSTMMVRPLRAACGRLVGYHDRAPADDYGLYAAYLLSGGRMRVLPEVLGTWRVTPDGVTSTRQADLVAYARMVLAFLRQTLPLDQEWTWAPALHALPYSLILDPPDLGFARRVLDRVPNSCWREARFEKSDIWRIMHRRTALRRPVLRRLLRHGSGDSRVQVAEFAMESLLRRLGVTIHPR